MKTFILGWIAEPCWRSAHQLVWPITRWVLMTVFKRQKSKGQKSVLLKISPPCFDSGLQHLKQIEVVNPAVRAGGKRPELQSIRSRGDDGNDTAADGIFLLDGY